MRPRPTPPPPERTEVATPLDQDVVLFYGSLVLSLAAVVLFLWLMRRPRDPNA